MISEKRVRSILPKTLLGDRLFALYRFYTRLGRFPEKRAIRFNDHLFAIKASGAGYDPLIQFVTDKEHVKQYVAYMVGKNYSVETYRILRNRRQLLDYAPDRFPCVLKPTHSSGQTMFCTDSTASFDRSTLNKWFDINYYRVSREHNYRHLVPKIIVEEFFSSDGRTIPNDYKVFCFNGAPGFIQVDGDRFSGHTRNLYDISWVRIPVTYVYPNREKDDPRPSLLDEMLRVAQKLSVPFPFVRVDMYVTEAELRVGEMSFFSESASGRLEPPEAEFILGSYFAACPKQ